MFVITCQHTEHRSDIFSGNAAEIPCARQDLHHLIQRVASKCRHGHQMLCKHIQALRGRIDLLHTAFPGKLRRHAAGDALRSGSGKKVHHACPPRIVPRPSKPLHRPRDGAWTPHLQHLIDLPYIDPQFHGGRRTQQAQIPIPQSLLCLRALFLGYTSVMHPRKTFSAQRIDIIRQFLRISSALHKSDHTAAALTVLIYKRTQLLPHRVFSSASDGIRVRSEYVQTDILLHGGCSDHDFLRRQIFCRRIQRFDRRRQTDALQRLSAEMIQTCDRKHQMCSPF